MSRRLRGADQVELQKKGLAPRRALVESVRLSAVALTVAREGVPVAMFGCRHILMRSGTRYGAIWLLGTDEFSRQRKWIARHSHEWLDVVASGCNFSGNVVDSCNRAYIRWLTWLGYEFLDETRWIGGHSFREFLKHHHV